MVACIPIEDAKVEAVVEPICQCKEIQETWNSPGLELTRGEEESWQACSSIVPGKSMFRRDYKQSYTDCTETEKESGTAELS